MINKMEYLLPLFTDACVPGGYNEDFKLRALFLFQKAVKSGIVSFSDQQLIKEDIESGSARVAIHLYLASRIKGDFVREHLHDLDKQVMVDATSLAREAHSMLCGWRNVYGRHFGVPVVEV